MPCRQMFSLSTAATARGRHAMRLILGNPQDSFAGLLNITQVHDVVVTGEGTLDCDAENGDWWVTPKIKRIAWRPRAVAAVDSENICLHGITVQNSYSWTIHPIFVKHLDLLNFMAMQSSPTWMFTPMMRIYSQLSGSMPSVLRLWDSYKLM